MLIDEKKEFDVDPDTVWGRVSDIKKIPEYWHGTKSIEVVGQEGDKTVVKIRFAFGGAGKAEISADHASRTLLIRYVSGPFTGTQSVNVRGRLIEARWDVGFKGIFKVASKWNEGHFRSGTVHALERLTSAAS